jgi:hypothetical protein
MGLLGADWQDKPRPPKRPVGKNLYTNPARKGGMGSSTKDRTIGQNPPEYMPDTYQHGRELGRELRKAARARIPKPFNSSPNKGNGYFNENPFKESSGPNYITKKDPPRKNIKPFVPSNPPKSGAAYSALSPIGRDYMPNPVREAEVWRQLKHYFYLILCTLMPNSLVLLSEA